MLANLLLLSKADSSLARIALEKKRINNDLKEKHALQKKSEQDVLQRVKALEERKQRYHKEERALRDEQSKLVDRRKALTTLSNYKLQEAGNREIEHASRLLGTREETLLSMLEELEKIEAETKAAQEGLAKLKEEIVKFEQESKDAFVTFEERGKRYQEERGKLAPLVDQASLKLYERLRERHPLDTIISVKNGSCSGCFMQIQPQVYVTIAKGDTLARCPGCGRILYVEEEKGSKEE